MKNVTQKTEDFGNNKIRVCTLVDGELLFEAVVSKSEVAATKSEQRDAAYEAIEADAAYESGLDSGKYGY